MKILCAEKHFEVLQDINFRVVASVGDLEE
jgi:hypothetical protein